MTQEEVISRVRKLYKLASKTNEHEAANAIAAAERLLQAHRLSAADLEDHPEVAIGHEEPLFASRRLPVWRNLLCGTLAEHYGCSACILRYRGKLSVVKVFGTPSDVALLRVQHENISRQVVRLAALNAAPIGRRYADAYRKGLVITVGKRLIAVRAEARQAASTTAIVRLDQRVVAAEQAKLEAANGKLGAATKVRASSLEGLDAGLRDGHHITLGGELGSAPVRGLLGD